MPIQCPACKGLNRDTAVFCGHCGSRLIAETSRATGPAGGRAGEPVPEQQTRPPTATPPPACTRSAPATLPLPPAQLPGVTPGPPPHRHPWRWYLVCTLVVAVLACFIVDPGRFHAEAGALFGAAALVLGLPMTWWSAARPFTSMGTATHLREWSPLSPTGRIGITPNWLFDLRLTDQTWNALADKKGFLLPIVEVEFRTDRLHGPPLDEGSHVVLRGRWKSVRVRASEVWNCSPGAPVPHLGAGTTFWGQVTGLQSALVPDMRYGGQRSLQVMSFRLQRTDNTFQLLRDEAGNLLPPLPVEIRAQAISGPLGDGDKVEISGYVVQGILYTREVRNHSASGAPPLVVKEWSGIS